MKKLSEVNNLHDFAGMLVFDGFFDAVLRFTRAVVPQTEARAGAFVFGEEFQPAAPFTSWH